MRDGRTVMVLSKAGNTATLYAQGGIAVVLPRTEDSVDAHVDDTLVAGAGLCDPGAVRSIVADGLSRGDRIGRRRGAVSMRLPPAAGL